MIVEPSTTCEFSDRPLKAATVRVVRLFAAAIVHSVSPGCTVWGTAAAAGAAGTSRAMRNGNRRLGLTFKDLRGPVSVSHGHPVAVLREPVRAGLRRPASGPSWHAQRLDGGRSEALGAEMALVRAQL